MQGRIGIAIILAVVVSLVATPVSAAEPPDQPDTTTVVLVPVPEDIPHGSTVVTTATDFNCFMSIYKLAASSVNVWITYRSPLTGTLIVIRKALSGSIALYTLVSAVNSCNDITKVQEELWTGIRYLCTAATWVNYPGSRQWWC